MATEVHWFSAGQNCESHFWNWRQARVNIPRESDSWFAEHSAHGAAHRFFLESDLPRLNKYVIGCTSDVVPRQKQATRATRRQKTLHTSVAAPGNNVS